MFQLERVEVAEGLDGVAAPVDVIAQEQILALMGLSQSFEQFKEVFKLAM